jgi:hypothetical protein
MPRYIDIDKTIKDIESMGIYYSEGAEVKEMCLLEIEGQPTADVVPRSEVEQAKQEVAREIFEEIEKYLALFLHIHRYAEEAKHSTEEYADGTPCEMTSVWEVLSLHKNGWDDYETMCKLQDNIGNIEKSRLLKEIEGDFAELKKKYIGE